MLDKIKSFYESVKAWFKYSETILWARLQTISGFVLAAIAGIDWTQLSISGLSKETAVLAGGLVLNGLFTEYLRRRNANI